MLLIHHLFPLPSPYFQRFHKNSKRKYPRWNRCKHRGGGQITDQICKPNSDQHYSPQTTAQHIVSACNGDGAQHIPTEHRSESIQSSYTQDTKNARATP